MALSKNFIQKDNSRHARAVLRVLKKTYPRSGMMLVYDTPTQLLVAVMLSAQCTDKKVNEVTKSLFKKYKSAQDFARADVRVLEKEIFQTGFYRAKSKHIIAACSIIEHAFHGKLPRTMKDMLTLPGVARKTANVVLGNAYGVVEGIAVDTHVARLSQRLGFTKERDPKKIERDLMSLFPKKEWFHLTYLLIEHGRALCTAKRRNCSACPLSEICPSTLTS